MNQDESTNSYSDFYTIGYTETSSKENFKTDTISNLLSNTWTNEYGWHTENSKADTVSNGRSFEKSSSNASTNEISVEDWKTTSIENTISKVTSNTISYMRGKGILILFSSHKRGRQYWL